MGEIDGGHCSPTRTRRNRSNSRPAGVSDRISTNGCRPSHTTINRPRIFVVVDRMKVDFGPADVVPREQTPDGRARSSREYETIRSTETAVGKSRRGFVFRFPIIIYAAINFVTVRPKAFGGHRIRVTTREICENRIRLDRLSPKSGFLLLAPATSHPLTVFHSARPHTTPPALYTTRSHTRARARHLLGKRERKHAKLLKSFR